MRRQERRYVPGWRECLRTNFVRQLAPVPLEYARASLSSLQELVRQLLVAREARIIIAAASISGGVGLSIIRALRVFVSPPAANCQLLSGWRPPAGRAVFAKGAQR